MSAFRFPCLFLMAMLLPAAGHATDCVTNLYGDPSLSRDAGCTGLKLASRKRDDPRPNIDIGATWAEFESPAHAGEWRYNDWVKKQVATLNFDRPISITPDLRSEDQFSIESLYRSERLISARYSRWICCGAHGATIYSSINVDNRRWTLLALDDLVDREAAANFCWHQFGGQKENGEAFAKAYPRERSWVENDFDSLSIGRTTHDMIGGVVVNTQPSKERTQRIFTSVIKDEGRWSFTGQGAVVDFGELLGYVSGPFTCLLQNVDLREIGRLGASFPP